VRDPGGFHGGKTHGKPSSSSPDADHGIISHRKNGIFRYSMQKAKMVYAGSVYIPGEDHWVISKDIFLKHMYIYM